MTTIENTLNYLEKLYVIFSPNDKEKAQIEDAIKEQSKKENLNELNFNLPLVIGELEEGKQILGKIIKSIRDKNRILKRDFEYFENISEKRRFLDWKNLITESYDYTEDYGTPLDVILNSTVINNLYSCYTDTLGRLQDIIRVQLEDEDNKFFYLFEIIKEESKEIDGRTLKPLRAEQLEFKLDGDNEKIILYERHSTSIYQEVSFKALGLYTKTGKINAKMSVLNKLINGEHIQNDSKASPHISAINKYFKDNLKIEDEVISSRKNNGKYKLIMNQKFEIEKDREIGKEDVLGHDKRHIDITSVSKSKKLKKHLSTSSDEFFHKSDSEYLSLDEYAEKEYNQPDDWDEASDENY